ncbi:DoxX family protein [Pelagibacterium sp.]|uniref:DoxX family protein n=1 Tax=Pelagibacterium sp. TaxID=1967288 RepID=UPI003A8F4C18
MTPPSMIARSEQFIASVPTGLVLLALRFALAVPFLRSGLTKWEAPFVIAPSQFYLFSQEFRLHIFGNAFPYPFPTLASYLAATGEIVFPILLLLGLGTRFAALGVLVMTAVIQLTVPEGWANFHLPWAAMALALMAYGGGPFCVDRLLIRRNQQLGLNGTHR